MEGREFSFYPQPEPSKDKEAQEKIKNKKEKKAFFERLQVIVRTVSGKKNLEVTSDVDIQTRLQMAAQGKDARREWFRQQKIDKRTGRATRELVHIPEEISEDEESAKGKAAHEAGHVAITRFGEFIPDKVIQELGFHAVLSSIEERPTDQVVRERRAGAGEWLDTARAADVESGKQAMERNKNLGYIPSFMQLCDLMVYEPHLKEDIPERYSSDVIKLYREIQEDVETVEHTLPAEGSNEKEIVEKAKERYKIIYKNIWPKVKNLIEQDRKNEELRQMIEKSMAKPKQDKGEPQKEEGNGEGGDDPSSEGTDEPDGKVGGDESPKSKDKEGVTEQNKETAEKEFSQDELPDELKKELQDAIEKGRQDAKKGEGAEKGEKTEASESDSGESDESGEEGDTQDGQPTPIQMDALSPGLKEALQKAFDSLPENVKQQIVQDALEMLQELEDEITSERDGKLSDSPAETHKEYEKRDEEDKSDKKRERDEETGKEKRSPKEEERIQKELAQIERRQAAIGENMDVYEKTYQEIHEADEELYRRLEEIFTPNTKRTMKLTSAGSRLNLPAVFRWEAARGAGAKSIDNRIFESTHFPEKKDYDITLLVDLSGSMGRGGKIEETFKAVVLLGEVLNRLGVRTEIVGFQDELIDFKDFDAELTDDTRKKISGMIDEVDNRNPGGHNRNSYNDDGPCLLEASKKLDTRSGKEKILLVLSDGIPEGRYSNERDLTEAVENILSTTNQKLIAVGLGEDTEHVTKFYPASIPNVDVTTLPKVLGDLLEDVLTNPQKYSASAQSRD